MVRFRYIMFTFDFKTCIHITTLHCSVICKFEGKIVRSNGLKMITLYFISHDMNYFTNAES